MKVYAAAPGAPRWGAAFERFGPVTHVTSELATAGDAVRLTEPSLLACFSAGGQWVRGVLRNAQNAKLAPLVACMDGAHSPLSWLDNGPDPGLIIEPWAALFERAAHGKARVFFSCSAIEPGSYASTRTTLSRILKRARLDLGDGERATIHGADCTVRSVGGLRVVTSTGADGAEHVRHGAMTDTAAEWLGSSEQSARVSNGPAVSDNKAALALGAVGAALLGWHLLRRRRP